MANIEDYNYWENEVYKNKDFKVIEKVQELPCGHHPETCNCNGKRQSIIYEKVFNNGKKEEIDNQWYFDNIVMKGGWQSFNTE